MSKRWAAKNLLPYVPQLGFGRIARRNGLLTPDGLFLAGRR